MTLQSIPASIRRPLTLALLGVATLLLPACNALDRVSNIGKAPQLAAIEDPSRQPGYTPVHLPMPAPTLGDQKPNSLWRTGARAFFKDQRANKTGDILTVLIEINDKAQLNNQTTRGRDTSENMDMPGLFGFERNIARVLPTPDDSTLNDLVSTASKSNATGTGAIKRDEQIELKVAALITQVLPNGNMVIQGKQEVRVNYELRELTINGVIRPEDINSQNTIGYEKIAEARIAYGGRGQITDVQQPRYGQQLIDIIAPF